MNFHKLALLFLAATLAACGGGDDGESNQINDWFSDSPETPPVVAPQNTPPVISISSPAGTSISEGEQVVLNANAIDIEDGDISSGLEWSSSLDDDLSLLGDSISTILSVGTHTITASVTDSDNALGSDSITVTVVSNPVEPPEFTPELSGVWNGTGSDSLTDTSSNVFLFTAEDGRLILASKETIYAEGSATLDGLELVGNITAEAASGTTFAGESKTADCSFNASFKTQMNISGTYSCPAGDGGSFNVDRISPLTAASVP
jgi:hypothetical protein